MLALHMARALNRIVVVDDHPLFVDALRLALRPVIGGASLATAASLADALEFLRTHAADLILLDLMLPDAGGTEGVARVREIAADARLVVISGRDDPVTVSLARALGADGFISKVAPLTAIQDQLGDIIAGRAVFPQPGSSPNLATMIATLTPAQARVLAAAATGKLNKQIAYEMQLAEPTIKAHMSAVFKKLGVNNRTQAILAINERF